MAVILLAVAVVVWLLRARRSDGAAFDWRLAGSTFAHVHWLWVAVSLIPIYATYWGRALAVGRLSQAAKSPPLHAQPALRHCGRLHRAHLVWPPWRVRAPLPHRPQGTGPGDLPVRRLGAGADLRPPDARPD